MINRSRGGCSAIIVGIVFFLMGALFLVLLGQEMTLTCRRLEPRFITCAKTATLFDLVPTQHRTIDGVEGAWVEESCDDGCTYRVVLETGAGAVPFTSAYSSGSAPKERMAEGINAFLAGGDPSLELVDSPSLLILLLPITFMALGPILVLQAVLGWIGWLPGIVRALSRLARG